jgi:carboxypeptidase C (cathepsin A)
VVYIEAPVGVGFSYSSASDTASGECLFIVSGDALLGSSTAPATARAPRCVDYACDDDSAARDNLAAVESLFRKFPEFAQHDLYITGESYVQRRRPMAT